MTCEFSLKHYIDTLKKYTDEGYIFKTFKTYNSNEKKQIVLRHDIDVSMEYALSMANTEKILGIKSTYMILMNSDFFNPLSPENIENLKTISEFHDIGIHYDSSILSDNKYTGSRTVMLQAELLEKFIGYNISTSCEHNSIMGKKPNIDMIGKLNHDYHINNANLLVNAKYISDSGMNWREGCFCQHVGEFDNLQINIHPLCWCVKGIDYDDIYETFRNRLKQKVDFICDEKKENRRNYIERIKA